MLIGGVVENQLDDDTELMLYYLRDAAGAPSLIAGTFVEPDGSAVETGADAVTVTSTSDWTSPESGATYPSGWTIRVPGRELALRLTPVLADQELDTRETTGVTYWEGDVTVDGTKSGVAITGVGYVELTGYAKARDGAAP